MTDIAKIAATLALLALPACASEKERQEWRDQTSLRDSQDMFERKYQSCIYKVTGPFGSASYPVMQECQKQGCAAVSKRRMQPLECREQNDG